MRPSFNKIKDDDLQILQSRITRWTSVFTLMSVALSILRIHKLHSLHFESRSVFLNGSTCRTWADFLRPLLLRFSLLFPRVEQLQLYLSDQTGRDILNHSPSNSPEDRLVVSARAKLSAILVVLENTPGLQSARFKNTSKMVSRFSDLCFRAVLVCIRHPIGWICYHSSNSLSYLPRTQWA